jgi:hypothetical protein
MVKFTLLVFVYNSSSVYHRLVGGTEPLVIFQVRKKGKSIPVTGREGP